MEPIVKAGGCNKREMHLAKLCENSFLPLWSYPNVCFLKSGICKEACDLLVVCNNNIIIFSDKNIKFNHDIDVNIAWKRWYRKAIIGGISSLNVAEKLLTNKANIFVDNKCTQKLPVKIKTKQTKIFRILVATGCQKFCKEYFNDKYGSLKFDSATTGDEKIFTIGNVRSSYGIVHILDESTLDIMLKELDTITDFTEYFSKKERLLESNNRIIANGEEDLLGLYISDINDDGDHDFIISRAKISDLSEMTINIPKSIWADIKNHPDYIEKKKADTISYFWDHIIKSFSENILNGTIIAPDGFEAIDVEIGIRYMALESRFARRNLTLSIKDAIDKVPEKNIRFARMLMPGDESSPCKTPYVWLLYPQAKNNSNDELEENRAMRSATLYAYCVNFLLKYKQFKYVVGIATTYPDNHLGLYSEDAIYIDSGGLTDDKIQTAKNLARDFDIMKPERMRFSSISGSEYPREMQSLGVIKTQQARCRRRELKQKSRKKR